MLSSVISLKSKADWGNTSKKDRCTIELTNKKTRETASKIKGGGHVETNKVSEGRVKV